MPNTEIPRVSVRLQKDLEGRSYFWVLSANRYRRINVDDVLWAEAGDKYVSTHLVGGAEVITSIPLKQFQACLNLMPVSRSVIVRPEVVTGFGGSTKTGWSLSVANGKRFRISRRHASSVRRRLMIGESHECAAS